MAKPNNMPIIAHICDSVKEYIERGRQIIIELINDGQLKCPVCMKPLVIKSSYVRGVKETGDKIEVVILRCQSLCEKSNALLPEFISPYKHYSVGEIEKVMTEVQFKRVSDINTEASESTIYRWLSQVGERITAAISVVKAEFIKKGAAVSELALDPCGGFKELESLLDRAPWHVRHCGSTLGLANLWLSTRSPPTYI